MKLFKKLLAAALAGVLALTLLTGCSGMLNKSQLVDALNAMHFLNDPDYPEVKTIVQGGQQAGNAASGQCCNVYCRTPG